MMNKSELYDTFSICAYNCTGVTLKILQTALYFLISHCLDSFFQYLLEMSGRVIKNGTRDLILIQEKE